MWGYYTTKDMKGDAVATLLKRGGEDRCSPLNSLFRYSIFFKMGRYLSLLALLALLLSCSSPLRRVVKGEFSPTLTHLGATEKGAKEDSATQNSDRVDQEPIMSPSGREIYLTQGRRESSTNEILPHRQLEEIFISAQREGLVEREGRVTVQFNIEVPKTLLDKEWQTELIPIVENSDTLFPLSPLLLSGKSFKKRQQAGYQKYNHYLSSLIPEDASPLKHFANLRELTLFLERYLPNSKLLSGALDHSLTTQFGVGEESIFNHYLNHRAIERNRIKLQDSLERFNRYINRPTPTKVHIDTLIGGREGHFALRYSLELPAPPLKERFQIHVKSSIFNKYGLSVALKSSPKIQFRVSSIAGLAQEIVRYKEVTIHRREQISLNSKIEFPIGSYTIDTLFSNNRVELGRVTSLLDSLYRRQIFDIDTISIAAYSSPEGNFSSNLKLSHNRASAIKRYLQKRVVNSPPILISAEGENWSGLYRAIESDSTIENRAATLRSLQIKNRNKRERALQLSPHFNYIKERLYPPLRVVKITIKLSRRGMIQESAVTTEIDTLYSRGLEALKNKRYSKAIELLAPYGDINSAVAHLAIGEDLPAFNILERLPESGVQKYLLALIAARKGEEKEAVALFLRSKELEPKMAHRGSLDPELSLLIERHQLNRELFD